ncbi:reverse transcriptase domain-containing protein [Tanacetum coccineum]
MNEVADAINEKLLEKFPEMVYVVKKHFPLSVSFAMTINKSQGQSLSKVGLYLPRPVFTQGQQCAVVSRVNNKKVTDAIEAIVIYDTKIRMAHDPMNQVVRQETTVEKSINNKRKFENQPKDSRVPQQPPFKKSDVARAYTTGANEKKGYTGNLPYCNKCKLHHVGPYTVRCGNCKRVGYKIRNCKTFIAAMNLRAHVAK